jgi:HTH-type transcriptional regulator/antitoxin HipB
MEDQRFGSYLRAERRRRHLRQADVGTRSGVSQPTISRLERGRATDLTLATLRRICAALDVRLELLPRGRGAEPEKLLDARHARLVGEAIRRLPEPWSATAEYTFNHYGDRGSVDVLAWHVARRALLLVEVKSELVDVQATLRSMHVKERVLPALVAKQQGWRARAIGLVLALPDEDTARRTVAANRVIFDATLPARTVAVRRWVGDPVESVHGVWFLSDMHGRNVVRNPGSAGRVCAARSRTLPGPGG